MKSNPLQLYYPTKPYVVIQKFGNNPLDANGVPYYSRFIDTLGNPYKGHQGQDLAAAHGTPLFAICDGVAMYNTDSNGGDGVILNTDGGFDYNGAEVGFNIIYWHMCSKNDPTYPIAIPCDGNWHPVKAGQLLGYSDNTGAPNESSGDHLHLGLCPLNAQWTALDPGNGYGGCIDPTPYFLSLIHI